MRILYYLTFVLLVGTSSCFSNKTLENYETLVIVETSEGFIKLKLYNETPLHRDNFIKLIQQSYYDGTLFHRVINEFMIQGGDPDSRFAKPGEALGNGGPKYTIPSEFRPQLYHKKGALAAARQGDQMNPERRSSGSQFYIVHGKQFTDEDLDQVELRINNMLKLAAFFQFIEEEKSNDSISGDDIDMAKIQETASLRAEEKFANMQPYKIPPYQRDVYKMQGGVPHLDQNYTVFGEIIEGMEILDKIAVVDTDDRNRPLKNIIIISMKIVKK
jgi:cyclophilin family peptidyl-prolyl cis-trans isomerase